MAQVNDVVGDLTLAFPQHAETGNLEAWRHGMELRDYFAAKALQSLMSHTSIMFVMHDAAGVMEVVTDAYRVADAMLKARER